MADRVVREAVRLLLLGVGWDTLADEQVRQLADMAAIHRGSRDVDRNPLKDPLPGDLVEGEYVGTRRRTCREVVSRSGDTIRWRGWTIGTPRRRNGEHGSTSVTSWRCWAQARGKVVECMGQEDE